MRTVVVTGASTGIGKATALRMDSAGWHVFAGIRREQDGDDLLRVSSKRLTPLKLDITKPDEISAAAAQIATEVGSAGLDGLVNNAGITIPCPLEVMPLDDFQRLIDVNLTGHLATTQALLPQLRLAKGRLVFVSSISSRRAIPMLGAYTASKAGLSALGDGFRQELGRWKIGVSVVEPGPIETPMWDRGEGELDNALGRSPLDSEHLYGKLIATFRDLADRTLDQRISPNKVVSSIEHALTAKRPRPRYVIGRDAKGQAFVTRFLPDRVLDFGVTRYLGI